MHPASGRTFDRPLRQPTDCNAEPTRIYFDVHEWAPYVDAQHRGGDGNDLAVKIEPAR